MWLSSTTTHGGRGDGPGLSGSRAPTARLGGLASAAILALALLVIPARAAAKVTPTFYTNASPSTTVGLLVFDHTNLSGASPTGTISFALFGPGDTACTTPVFTSAVGVSGTGSDNSPKYTTSSAGSYRWVAAYGGDAANNPVASACGTPSQALIVGRASPVATTTAAVSAGSLHATTTLSAGFAPLTGTITFTLTGPNDQFCAGTPVWSSNVAVNGAGSYDSGLFTPRAAGTYTYRIHYSGNTNNLDVGPTSCLGQGGSVAIGQGQLAPPPAGGPPPATKPPGAGPPAGTKPAANGQPATSQGAGAGGPSGGPPGGPGAAPDSAGLVFHGPARCVHGPFKVYVGGARIRRVTYYLRGRPLRTVTRADARGRFPTTVNPRGLRRRAGHRLTAKVAAAGGQRVLHRVFTVCA